MKIFKRIAACALAVAMAASITACEEETPQSGTNPNGGMQSSSEDTAPVFTTDDETDREVKDISSASFTPDGNAGKVTLLSWYDISADQKGRDQTKVFLSEAYGGELEMISCTPLIDSLLEKLAILISSDESPDLVTNDAWLYPGNAAKGSFMALDEYIDYTTPLWSDMAPYIESNAYGGKHYYYPHRLMTNDMLNYSKKTIEENNLDDPYDLYREGKWTWDEWKRLMTEFCDKDEDRAGYFATDNTIVPFFATTGITLISVQPDGTVNNNVADPAITRAMMFLEGLYREGLAYSSEKSVLYQEFGPWIDPGVYPRCSDKILFLCMEPEWSYIAETNAVQNPKGVENDIFGTPSDFAFVPYPRDPDADEYYQALDTFGFLVPKGAKNVKGAIDWINCYRVYDTDEGIIAQTREEHINPTPEYYTSGPNKGIERWQITWSEREYDLWRELCNPNTFVFRAESAGGFNTEFWTTLVEPICDSAFRGDSWTQRREEIMPKIEATLNDFRAAS
ncbi:MAG: ABC transporter substrate-binding protein [Oscillospiraceae bacterium]